MSLQTLTNSMRLMQMLPQLFKTGNLIVKSLEGGVTSEEMAAIMKEIRETIKSVPELSAFLQIFDVLVKVAALVLPTILGDKAKVLALGLEMAEVEQALTVAKLMDNIIEEAVVESKQASDKLTDDDVEGMI